jgi:hypothetical protein
MHDVLRSFSSDLLEVPIGVSLSFTADHLVLNRLH